MSLQSRCVPCGSERSPATNTSCGRCSSSKARTGATSAAADWRFANGPRLVKRQVQESAQRTAGVPSTWIALTASDSRIRRLIACTSATSMSPADFAVSAAFDTSDECRDGGLSRDVAPGQSREEVEVAADIMIEDRDVATRHVGDRDDVLVLDQLPEDRHPWRSRHHRVRREHHDSNGHGGVWTFLGFLRRVR